MQNRKVHFSAGVCILLALMLLVLPIQWIIAAVIAAAVHEGYHALAVVLCGGEITGFSVRDGGASMTVAGLSRSRELICALAGPLGGLTLLLLARHFPRIALCAAVHSVYNLLPLYPLDGGRALRCIALLTAPASAQRICSLFGRISLAGITLLALYCTFFLKLGLLPLVTAAVICFGKSPCKEDVLAVQ